MAFLLHHLLAESAARNPAQMAVVGEEGSLRYGELDALSSQLAHQLRAAGVRSGDRVGLFMNKSAAEVAGLFAILKAGAAYVPIDPYAPPQRAAYILRNCAVRALITTTEKLSRLGGEFFDSAGLGGVVLMEEKAAPPPIEGKVPAASLAEVRATRPTMSPDVPVTDNHLAYILYTSGSTGEPKGVMISHLNSLTFVNWGYDTFRIQPTDRVSSHAPFHFDLSIFDLFCTIKAGGTVHLVPASVIAFPVELARWIAANEITVWYSVPSALIQLVERGHLNENTYEKLRLVLFAGEVFPIKYLRRLVQALPHPAYFNLYGPTDTNVCTYYQVRSEDIAPERTEPVSIGRACANTEVVAVNELMRPAGVAEVGELYVRGSTVMKGYWGRPQDTAQMLVANSLNPHYSDLRYRTGDLVRLMPDGNYQFVGRRDKMIKSRGYRIELGEIEAALYCHPDVKEAAVIALPDEEVGARIKAYVVAQDGLARAELERHCSQRLPRYMMPEWLEFRRELPKTSTGKIDKTSLEKESRNACNPTNPSSPSPRS